MNPYQVYSDYLFAKADETGTPLSGTFELTARCNLDCKMCYIHKRENDKLARSREYSAAQWLELAAECQKAGMLHLLLTGGEPMIRPDFKEIYTGCRRLGLMVSVNTNATLIDDEMVKFFAVDPPSRVNISLYGACRETYETLCRDGSAYDRVIEAILALKAAGVLVKINFSATHYNQHDAQSVYAFAKKHELPLQAATYMFPPMRACENGCFAADRMTPQEAAQAQVDYDRSRFTPEQRSKRWAQQLAGIKVSDPDSECQELPTERIRCRAGSSTFWLTYDGYMRPCGMMVEPSVYVPEMGFSAAWQKIRQEREKIMVSSQCTSCEIRHACDQCAAVCFAETGLFTGVPTYMCEKTRAYLDLIRRSTEEIDGNLPEN